MQQKRGTEIKFRFGDQLSDSGKTLELPQKSNYNTEIHTNGYRRHDMRHLIKTEESFLGDFLLN